MLSCNHSLYKVLYGPLPCQQYRLSRWRPALATRTSGGKASIRDSGLFPPMWTAPFCAAQSICSTAPIPLVESRISARVGSGAAAASLWASRSRFRVRVGGGRAPELGSLGGPIHDASSSYPRCLGAERASRKPHPWVTASWMHQQRCSCNPDRAAARPPCCHGATHGHLQTGTQSE